MIQGASKPLVFLILLFSIIGCQSPQDYIITGRLNKFYDETLCCDSINSCEGRTEHFYRRYELVYILKNEYKDTLYIPIGSYYNDYESKLSVVVIDKDTLTPNYISKQLTNRTGHTDFIPPLDSVKLFINIGNFSIEEERKLKNIKIVELLRKIAIKYEFDSCDQFKDYIVPKILFNNNPQDVEFHFAPIGYPLDHAR